MKMYSGRSRAFLVLIIAIGWVMLHEIGVHAETYIAGQVGVSFPLPATVKGDENVDYPTPPGPGRLFRNSETRAGLHDSVTYGGKMGHYFEAVRWLGVETEAFTATPHVMAGTLAINTNSSSVGTFSEAQTGLNLRVTTWAFNVLIRYPGERFQPYAGMGPGIFFGHVKGTGLSCNNTCQGPAVDASSTSPGLNTQLGLRYLLTEHVGMFVEWKFNHTTAHFDHVRSLSNLSVSYNAHSLMFGLGYHF